MDEAAVEGVLALEAKWEVVLEGVGKEAIEGVVLGLVGLCNLFLDQRSQSHWH